MEEPQLEVTILEQYSKVRNAFQTVFKDETPKLPCLGPAVWEVSLNPDEELYSQHPPPLENSVHTKIQKLLQLAYGAPVFCWQRDMNYGATDVLVKNGEEWVNVGRIDEINVALLKSLAKPSPYGDLTKMETVYDKNVRDAWEITEFRFETKGKTSELPRFVEKGILPLIQQNMELKNICLRPQKINIYEEGGFFKPHTDTPQNPQKTIGSLVITLPSEYEGGEFVINHMGTKHTFSGKTTDINWISFYADCLHEVLPVTSGTRISLTCYIDVTDSPVPSVRTIKYKAFHPAEIGPLESRDLETRQQTLDQLVQVLKHAPDPAIGILLGHKYTQSALEVGVLKGSDRVVADHLKSHGFGVHIQSVLYKSRVVDYSRDSGSYTQVHSCSQEDLDYVLGKGPKPVPRFRNVPFFRMGPLSQHIDSDSEEEGNMGKECDRAQFQKLYWNAALIITPPTWWTKARLLLIGKMKNSYQECHLAGMSMELIKEICMLVKKYEEEEEEMQQQAHEKYVRRKNRRDHSDSESD